MTKSQRDQKTSSKKVAVVTGALKGLGLQTARELVNKGYEVILAGRDPARGEKVLSILKNDGLLAHFEVLDVADVESIESFSNRVIEKFHRVDVLVNNAGIYVDGSDESLSLSQASGLILNAFQTNTLGAYLLCRKLLPLMVENGFGRIVNVSSGMGQLSEMDGKHPAYRFSKTALNAVTASLACDVKGQGILINSVCPGWVRTEMGGKDAERSVEEGAETIVWAATLPNDGPTGGFFRDKEPLDW